MAQSKNQLGPRRDAKANRELEVIDEDDILSADVVFSTQEIIDEFYKRCQESLKLMIAVTCGKQAKICCRTLDRDYKAAAFSH